MNITQNADLRDNIMPRLQRVNDAIIITENPSLQQLNLSLLASCTSITVSDNAKLSYMEFPKLESIPESAIFDNNFALASMGTFSNLVHLGQLSIQTTFTKVVPLRVPR